MVDDDARRQKIESIFESVCDQPASMRRASVEAACGEDSDLKDAVEALLAADAGAGAVVDDLAGRLDISRMLQVGRGRAGQAYGSYTLTECLGTGGMGEVWRGTRSDGRFEADVAVKLLWQSVASEANLKRFQRETRIAANLHHAERYFCNREKRNR